MLLRARCLRTAVVCSLAIITPACGDDTEESATGGTTTGPVGSTGDTDVVECASPDFDPNSTPEDPKLYQCVGEEIGSFVFTVCIPPFCVLEQTIYLGLDPDEDEVADEPIPFPGNIFNLDAATCCTDNIEDIPAAKVFADNACVADCARAACNFALASFNENLESPEIAETCFAPNKQDCIDTVIESLTHFRNELQANMEDCVIRAQQLSPNNIMEFTDPPCADAIVRPKGCLVDGQIVLGSGEDDEKLVSCALTVADLSMPIEPICEMSLNELDTDPARGLATIEGGLVHVTGPSNEQVDALVVGQSIRTAEYECEISPCAFVLEELSVDVEDFSLGSISFQDVHAELLRPATGSIEGVDAAFPAGSIEVRITGMIGGPLGIFAKPFEVLADSDAAASCWHDPTTISLDNIFFDLGLFTASAAIDPSPCVPVP